MGCFNGSLYIFPFARSVGKKWALDVLLVEFRNQTVSFELFKRKISEFRGIQWSNLWYESYSFNQRDISLLPVFSLYFEKKGIQMIGNLFQPKILPKFYISINGSGLLLSILRKTKPFWFLSLFALQRRSCFVKCIHTFYEKWYRDYGCLTRDWAIIRF